MFLGRHLRYYARRHFPAKLVSVNAVSVDAICRGGVHEHGLHQLPKAERSRALRNDLVTRLGQDAVFMDVDSISLRRDFRSELQKKLSACDNMLVLIDKDWAAVKDEKGQIRLEKSDDFVRVEIEATLKRDIAVTPVLLKGAQMPAAEELPAEISALAYRQGCELSHSRWDSDVREMIRRLGLDAPGQGEQVETDRRPIAPGEAGGGSVPAGARPRQESRPLAFVQAAAGGRTLGMPNQSTPHMNFLQAISSGLTKYAIFSGRASRSEFWYFCLFYTLLLIPTLGLAVLIGVIGGWIVAIYVLGFLLPSFALFNRRLHDINRSGWWWLLILAVALSGWWLLILARLGAFVVGREEEGWLELLLTVTIIIATLYLVVGCLKGTEGPNRFGPDPLP
jgi:uncharacterized membrane protein YhaH (DUF805 family)